MLGFIISENVAKNQPNIPQMLKNIHISAVNKKYSFLFDLLDMALKLSHLMFFAPEKLA